VEGRRRWRVARSSWSRAPTTSPRTSCTVTDARAAKSEHGTIKKLYEKNRGSAKKNVVEADSGAGPPDREAPGRGRRDPAGVTLPATA
jgi:hypothetical protein